MALRHTLARVLAVALGVTGCYANHGLTGEDDPADRDAGGGARDAGVGPSDAGVRPRDASPRVDSSAPDAGAFDAAVCEPSRTAIGIELVPASAEWLCAYGHHEAAAITSVESEPAENGIRLHADFCPTADHGFCPCDIVIANTGPIDLARLPFPRSNLTIDIDRQYVVVQKTPTCRCDGCGCDFFLAFVAAHEDPDTARDLPPEIAFTRGSVACPTTSVCDRTDSYRLRLSAWDDGAEIDEGTERTFGAIVVRNVQNAVGLDVCAACADCGAVRGSFMAWVDADRAGP